MINITKNNNWGFDLKKLYLLLISVIGIIGFCISIWKLGHSFFTKKLITNEEYVQSRRSYQIERCKEEGNANGIKEPTTQSDNNKEETFEPTDQEVQECIDSVYKDAKNERSLNLKEDMISWWVWGLIFLLLFVTHFPFFIKTVKE